jgi:hypothetical protein
VAGLFLALLATVGTSLTGAVAAARPAPAATASAMDTVAAMQPSWNLGNTLDQSLTLNLNGTSFRGLWQGGTKLAQGVDYTVSRDRLTLAAAALTRLTGDRAYGVNATLEARFSSGVPWRIDVTTYDAPVFAGATGTAGSFAAPAQFLGDSLEATTPVFCTGVLFLPPPP